MEHLPVLGTPPTLSKLCLWLWHCSYAILVVLCCMNSACKSVRVAVAAASTPVHAGNESDRLSLLAFRGAITAGDPSTGALRSWNESLHHCRWRGVTCGGRRHPERVTALSLSSLSLGGYISPSVANLTFLREIDLGGNRLIGGIPPQLGALSRLRYLFLSNNTLVGEIPSNLSLCSELRGIRFENNQLTGEIPVALGNLPSLRFLFVESNRITGSIPASLGNLSSTLLKVLLLGDNALTGGIPGELGRLKNLESFQVDKNNLSGTVPPSFYNLSNLAIFQVAYNRLSGTLPSDLGTTLPKLWWLNVAVNQFEGNIPSSLPNASSLQAVELSFNMFEGTIPDNFWRLKVLNHFSVAENRLEAREPKDWKFFTSLTNCTLLRRISIWGNELRGELPASIANFSAALEFIAMAENQISGSIPSGMENLVGLTVLAMWGNQFTGSIPSTLGKLSNLGRLYLGSNQLSGEIPSELGNLTKLSELNLRRNNLSGSIPTSIGRCKQLQQLRIFDNSLRGKIPEQVFTSLTLLVLDLSSNHLEGSIPPRVGQMLGLRYLNLSANRLSGYLPTTLGGCQSLEEVYLDRNSFEGTIPPSLRSLKGVEVVDLSVNNLTGGVPEFLAEFRFLRYLNLSFNNFIGEVPKGGVFANASAISLLGNRKVCGGIAELSLPACPSHEENGRKGAHKTTVIIVVAVVAGLCILFFVACVVYWFRRMKESKGKKSSASPFESKFQKISYRELFKVTDGFSPNNLIGTGSFGCVYKGILDGDQRTVAIKVMNIQRRGALRSFKAECEALRSIRHRNLVKIVSVCSSIDFGGREFKALVYEFFPNGSLEKWLHSEQEEGMRPLDFGQRLSIVADVALALDYLHNLSHSPVVHCDLKPSNILLDDNMTAHVGDFGLARFIPGPSSQDFENQSSASGMKGSIGYVPPEYGMGSPVSTCGDVYSFGIVLLELFTAKRPVDDMFRDGLSLQKFVEVALPREVMGIADPHLLPTTNAAELMQECLISLMQIGLNCARELRKERMTMEAVVKEIQLIQKSYLKGTN